MSASAGVTHSHKRKYVEERRGKENKRQKEKGARPRGYIRKSLAMFRSSLAAILRDRHSLIFLEVVTLAAVFKDRHTRCYF
jgi:hypothetical protein